VASLLTWGCPPTDPLDRLVRRTDKGVVTQFAYRGLGDVPMGARPYTASTARFLTVDPIHGGCANHYVYGFGDPFNAQDLTGKRTGNLCSEMWDIDWSDLAIGPSTILTIGSVIVARISPYAAAAMGAAALYLDVKDCLQSGGVACGQAGLGLVLPSSRVAAGVSIAIDVLDGAGQGAASPLAGNQSVWLRQQYWMDCWAAGLPYPGWKRHGQYE